VEIPGQTEVRRENLQRTSRSPRASEGVDLGSGVAAVQRAIADLHVPAAIAPNTAAYTPNKGSRSRPADCALLAVRNDAVLLFEFCGSVRPGRGSRLLSMAGVSGACHSAGTPPTLRSWADHGQRYLRRHPPADGSAIPGRRSLPGREA
jgi:hypothetical protein